MLGSATRQGVAVLVVVLGASAGFSPVEARQSAYEKAIGRAVRLLARQPDQIVIVERDNQSRFRKGKAHVEAFVADGQRVYLVRQGVTLQAALKGPGIYDYVLATIVWHEMAHIDGADEAAAQEAEEQLWMQFIVARGVDSTRGMQYLALLRKRRS
jgi:transketolase C-terminal domain/subunit